MVKKLELYKLAYSDMYAAFLFDIFNISDNFQTSKFDIYAHLFKMFENDSPFIYDPVHEISNNEVCSTSKTSDQPAHTRSLIRAFASRLIIL